jgi:hypothetical protein
MSMSKRVLQVIDQPYRCTVEEQDDPIVWFTHALRGAGADLGLLLRGSCVNYAVRGQDASGLRFGERAQTQPPRIDRELERLVQKGVDVYAVEDDLESRGLASAELFNGTKTIARRDLPELFERYDEIWHW